MGCGEGDLGKKTKKIFSEGLLAGIMGITAGLVLGGVPIGFYALSEGEERGYEAGKKAGVAEGQELSMQDVRLKIDTVRLQDLTIKDVYGDFGNYSFWAGNCKTLNEGMHFSKPDGEYYIYDVDGIFNEGVREFRAYHDGLVDFVQLPDGSALLRENDYGANKALFDEADALLKNTKEQFNYFR
jgi:hypothetical protein